MKKNKRTEEEEYSKKFSPSNNETPFEYYNFNKV